MKTKKKKERPTERKKKMVLLWHTEKCNDKKTTN